MKLTLTGLQYVLYPGDSTFLPLLQAWSARISGGAFLYCQTKGSALGLVMACYLRPGKLRELIRVFWQSEGVEAPCSSRKQLNPADSAAILPPVRSGRDDGSRHCNGAAFSFCNCLEAGIQEY